jgi:8-oxo-dGTP pyrophosphatase MutT (NUDIX family)
MTNIAVGSVDVLLLDPAREHRLLVLERAQGTRCTGSWEVVHGRIEDGERPEDAARREAVEETGLVLSRLYVLGCQPFYLPRQATVNIAVVFAAFVDSTLPLMLGVEHSAGEWLLPADAEQRLSWPRTRQALRDALLLLEGSNAGPVEDVLRIDEA